jgi:hypothetical protein
VFVLFAFGYPPLCWLLWNQMSPVRFGTAWRAMVEDFRRTPRPEWGWVLLEHLPTVIRLLLGGGFWGTIPVGFVTLGQICGGVEALRILVDAVFRLIDRLVPPPLPASTPRA